MEVSCSEEDLSETQTSDDEENAEDYDSDTVLQELFAAGKLKPGLNIPIEKKCFINNVKGLEKSLEELKKNLKWSERLDIVSKPAPMAPELRVDLDEQEEFAKSGRTDDIALNEFKRETMFHRQAQSSIIEGVARMRSQGIPTLRPEDYFAEMMKSDNHMQKVRKSLLQKQAGMERSEKIKKMRQERKFAKAKQVEAMLQKQQEKKKLAEDVKKYRRGAKNTLDFLNEDKKSVGKGKKRKLNNGGGGGKFGKDFKRRKVVKKSGNKKQRPGKNRRKNMKGGKK